MSDFLLTLIINYGAPVFAVMLFLGALGVPIGASVLVIAAGAFSQQGILNWPTHCVSRSGWRGHWRCAQFWDWVLRQRLGG